MSLARQHHWSFVGRTHYEYQITIARRDRQVRLSAYPELHVTHGLLEVRVETPPPGLPQFRIAGLGSGSFEVSSPEPDELRRVWTAERSQFAQDRLAAMDAHATREQLIVKVHRTDRPGDAFDDAMIVDALELALDLATADVYGFAALRTLPEAVVKQAGGPHIELPGPAPIVIRPVRDGDRVFTKATMQGELPGEAPSVSALGSAALAQEGDVIAVSWPALEEDPDQLMAAVELLRTLGSAPHDGAYR